MSNPREMLARNAAGDAAELLRLAILDGTLRPGERLKETQLAERFGISRTPIREALVHLGVEGMVIQVPNKGATVREYTPDDIDDAYELRALLEGHAGRRAAASIDPETLAELFASCERFAGLTAPKDHVELTAENKVFHGTLIAAAKSPRLEAVFRSTMELPLIYKSFFWYSEERKQVSEEFHIDITKALAAHDGDRAELLLRNHVFEARDFLLDQLAQGKDGPAAAAGRSASAGDTSTGVAVGGTP